MGISTVTTQMGTVTAKNSQNFREFWEKLAVTTEAATAACIGADRNRAPSPSDRNVTVAKFERDSPRGNRHRTKNLLAAAVATPWHNGRLAAAATNALLNCIAEASNHSTQKPSNTRVC
jgi:hypothetical protein